MCKAQSVLVVCNEHAFDKRGVEFNWNYLEHSFESCLWSNGRLQHLKDILKRDVGGNFP